MKYDLFILTVLLASIAYQALAATSVTIHGITDTLKPEYEKYSDALTAAADAFQEAEELFNDDGFINQKGWKKDGESADHEIVYSKHVPRGKIATITTILDANVDEVMKETWKAPGNGLEKWNPNVDYASVVISLTEHADITNYGFNNILVVQGRDFVSARVWRPIPTGGYIMATRSVNVSDALHHEDKVRAHIFLAAARFRPDVSDPEHKTRCDVVMLADLKGMIPKLMTSQAIPQIMLLDAKEVKKHFRELNAKKAAANR